MPRFAANLTTLFREVDFLERFERAARVGFRAVECQFPYEHAPEAIAARLREHGLDLVLINAPAGDADRGDRGLGAVPGREAEFSAGIEQALRHVEATGAGNVHVMAGRVPPGADRAAMRSTFVANLRHASARLATVGARALIEPLNRHDVPGYFLSDVDEAASIRDEVGAANLFIQLDVYHVQRTSGDLAATMERLLPAIGHVQIADVPGRHEPGTGEIAFPFLFDRLDRLGYAGWIGCEYTPSGVTEASFGWLDDERARAGERSLSSPAR